jgi:hypothetical protein
LTARTDIDDDLTLNAMCTLNPLNSPGSMSSGCFFLIAAPFAGRAIQISGTMRMKMNVDAYERSSDPMTAAWLMPVSSNNT